MRKSLITVSLLTLATLWQAHSTAQAPAAPAKLYPVQAELVASLSASKLKVGDRVLAKLKQDWVNPACSLPRGSALIGHVTALDAWSKTSKSTRIGLLFEVTCGDAAPQSFAWIALLGPDDSDLAGVHDGNPVARQALRSSSFGEDNGLRPATNTQANHSDLSGRQNPNFPVQIDPAPDRSHPRPTSIFTGQVWGIPDLALSVSTGPGGSSVLSSTRKSIHLAAGAILVLSPPRSEASASSTATSQASPEVERTSPAAVAANAVDTALRNSDQCQPPTCAYVPRTGHLPSDVNPPSQTLSLDTLNYHHLKSAEMLDFEFGSALAYLGPHHLLFTFNPHTLVPRQAQQDPGSHPHMVRAILFNLLTGAAEASDEWRVNDDRQYLWPLAEGQVLVHSGDRLRLLELHTSSTRLPGEGPRAAGLFGSALPSAHLEEVASIPLKSALAFVRSAPDRQHIAVGTIHELHAPDVHAALAEANTNGPEEEVTILLLDRALHPIQILRESSYALPPIFSDHGRITLFHSGGDRWRFGETSWTGTTRTLARVRSACIPEISALAKDLFFVGGCDPQSVDRWYRILRSDGSTVLKGILLTHEMKPLPLGNISGDTFALALPAARDGYVLNGPFHGADLSSEIIRVFRSANGLNIFAAGVHAPSPNRQPMAFAPTGDRIAVLDGNRILIYPIGETSPAPVRNPPASDVQASRDPVHSVTTSAPAQVNGQSGTPGAASATYPIPVSSNAPTTLSHAAPLR